MHTSHPINPEILFEDTELSDDNASFKNCLNEVNFPIVIIILKINYKITNFYFSKK